MGRVTEPLSQMGARFQGQRERLPLTMAGGRLSPLIWQSPVASAQVKGALLLAGVSGGVPVSVTEPTQSRDHTERMLASFGFRLRIEGTTVHFEPTGRITPFELTVPGDPSSAAFLVAAAILGGSRPVRISGVGLNPTRTGFLRVLERMGRPVAEDGTGLAAGEPIGDLLTSGGTLRSTTVTAPEIPALVDEVPILACLAARAEGESRFEGLSELRVKESDRLALLATNLQAIGIEASVSGDDLTVVGSDRPLAGRVVTGGDHRIAMAFAVLGHGHPVTIDDPDCAAVSFPGFEAAVAAVHQEVA
jgi:3-phosphoshikimate 1-carboxyvinyltransferase